MTRDEFDKIKNGKWDNRSLLDAAETFTRMGDHTKADKIIKQMSKGDRLRYVYKLMSKMPVRDVLAVIEQYEKGLKK